MSSASHVTSHMVTTRLHTFCGCVQENNYICKISMDNIIGITFFAFRLGSRRLRQSKWRCFFLLLFLLSRLLEKIAITLNERVSKLKWQYNTKMKLNNNMIP